MNRIKLGDHEVIKKNYDYLMLAKQNGFFQNGFDPEDIASCDDWVVAWWIDELGTKKQNEDKFKNEILPSFKRWFSSGVNSTGVGTYYEILRQAELCGLKIDRGFFDCITWLNSRKKSTNLSDESILETPSTFEEIMRYFENEELFRDLLRWKKMGTPLLGETGEFYDTFKQLEDQGEVIDFHKFIFFYTLKNKFDTTSNLVDSWEYKKELEEKYGISVISGDEFERLQGWNYGYNYNVIDDLQKRIEQIRKHIPGGSELSNFSMRISRYAGKDVSILYSELTELGEDKLKAIKGKLISCNGDSISILIKNQQGEESAFTLINGDNRFISKIAISGYGVMYEDRNIKNRINIRRNEMKIARIKSDDLLSKYIEKFSSVKGLAYLKNNASTFIERIEPNIYPINNLFAFCFELIGSDREEDVQKVLYAYNMIRSGQLEFLKNGNYGYPIVDFLSEYTQNKVTQYCYYVTSTVKNEDLPPLPLTKQNNHSGSPIDVSIISYQNDELVDPHLLENGRRI